MPHGNNQHTPKALLGPKYRVILKKDLRGRVCGVGHTLNQEQSYYDKNGRKHCLPCRKRRDHEYHLRKMAIKNAKKAEEMEAAGIEPGAKTIRKRARVSVRPKTFEEQASGVTLYEPRPADDMDEVVRAEIEAAESLSALERRIEADRRAAGTKPRWRPGGFRSEPVISERHRSESERTVDAYINGAWSKEQ